MARKRKRVVTITVTGNMASVLAAITESIATSYGLKPPTK